MKEKLIESGKTAYFLTGMIYLPNVPEWQIYALVRYFHLEFHESVLNQWNLFDVHCQVRNYVFSGQAWKNVVPIFVIKPDIQNDRKLPLVIAVAEGGKDRFLKARSSEMKRLIVSKWIIIQLC